MLRRLAEAVLGGFDRSSFEGNYNGLLNRDRQAAPNYRDAMRD